MRGTGRALGHSCSQGGWDITIRLTVFHRLIHHLGLFLALGFGDHHGCEWGDKAVVE